jgi:hypothetical protein
MSTIRRSIEIDVLQNRKYTDSNCSISNDQTVFISSLDLTGEIVVLTNPTNKNVSIEKWSISDGKKLHTFVFPVNCVIHGNSTLNVYTCPGGEHNGGVFINPCVLWTNLDGTMRRKEVLNNGVCVSMIICFFIKIDFIIYFVVRSLYHAASQLFWKVHRFMYFH